MTYRLRSLVAIAAACGALLTGCGSSSSSSSSSSAAAPATSTSTSSASTATGAATSTGAGASTSTGAASAVANNPAVKAAVAQCKTAINSAPQLSATSKTQLDDLCDKAASGKLTDLRQVTYDVCKQVIKDSVPAAEQQTALASCPKP
jgi:hypothetical protein